MCKGNVWHKTQRTLNTNNVLVDDVLKNNKMTNKMWIPEYMFIEFVFVRNILFIKCSICQSIPVRENTIR